jgi:hypothetical protein
MTIRSIGAELLDGRRPFFEEKSRRAPRQDQLGPSIYQGIPRGIYAATFVARYLTYCIKTSYFCFCPNAVNKRGGS